MLGRFVAGRKSDTASSPAGTARLGDLILTPIIPLTAARQSARTFCAPRSVFHPRPLFVTSAQTRPGLRRRGLSHAEVARLHENEPRIGNSQPSSTSTVRGWSSAGPGRYRPLKGDKRLVATQVFRNVRPHLACVRCHVCGLRIGANAREPRSHAADSRVRL